MSQGFALIGAGWRAEFFLRIARDRPDLFPCVGVVSRQAATRERLAKTWGVAAFASAEELLAKTQPAFAVTSVPWAANLPVMEMLAAKGMAILSETPIAPELDNLRQIAQLAAKGTRIQVAEQYFLQPMHAARLAVVASGKLGTVREVDVSIAHGYHGLSLLRKYLGTGLAKPRITARKFTSPIIAGPGRNGPPAELATKNSERIIAQLDFGDKFGIMDFAGDQYFSWIRSSRLLVRGEAGEIKDETVRLLADFQTPFSFDLVRHDTGHGGNLEGYAHRSIMGGGEIWYQNPFQGARWSDDEVAVATCLQKMQHYVETGEPFYSVAEACHDRYLDLLIDRALSSNAPVTAEEQPWTA